MFRPLRVSSLILISFLLMSNCLDLVPHKIYGVQVLDIGYLLFFLTWFLVGRPKPAFWTQREGYEKVLTAFMLLLGFSFLWSVAVFRYPVSETVKAARHMILGYFTYYIFVTFFERSHGTFTAIFKALYSITLVLLPIFILQYHLNVPLFFGYTRESSEGIRSIPIFIPIVLLYMYNNISKLLTGYPIGLVDKAYVLASLYAVGLTFTRGIYFSVFFTIFVMLMILLVQYRGRRGRLSLSLASLFLLFGVFVLTGPSSEKLSSFVTLARSGVTDIAGAGDATNTFGFRMLLLAERFELVARHNPYIGYGFIHEDNATKNVKFSIGTVTEDGNGMAFKSADIAWANILINTGFSGVFLFIAFICCIVVNYFRNASPPVDQRLYLQRLSLFLEIISLVVLMANSSTFTEHVQIPALFLAAYTYCSKLQYQAYNLQVYQGITV